jgi:hypothetical protein
MLRRIFGFKREEVTISWRKNFKDLLNCTSGQILSG